MEWTNSPTKEELKDNYGFIYQLEFEGGYDYYGKKNFIAYKKRPFTKEEREEYKSLNGKYPSSRMKKTIERESNWKDYEGSLNTDMKLVSKHIVRLCKTKIDLTYWENYYLYVNNCLFDIMNLNKNIGGNMFAGKITGSKEYIKD